jgi:hypothetical protein
LSLYAIRTEFDLGITLAFQDILVHFAVAAAIACLPGGSVEHDFPGDCCGGGIEMDLAAFYLEFSVDGM